MSVTISLAIGIMEFYAPAPITEHASAESVSAMLAGRAMLVTAELQTIPAYLQVGVFTFRV